MKVSLRAQKSDKRHGERNKDGTLSFKIKKIVKISLIFFQMYKISQQK